MGLHAQFMQQYSRIGNRREQLFHVGRTFHFDEKSETIDSCITCIRQVAALSGYGEPQILEVFKGTLLSRLCWVLFPIEDQRQTVETAKRILTKEMIDRKLAGQSTSTPFMSIQEDYSNSNKRTVSSDTKDMLDNKIDKLTSMMSKLSTQSSHQIFQGRRNGHGRNNYYDRGRQHDRFRLSSGDRYRRSNYRDRPQYGQNDNLNMVRIIEGETLGEETLEEHKNNRGQTFRNGYRGNHRNSTFDRRRSRSRDRQLSDIFRRNDRSCTRSRSGLRASTK